jgi:hypothetical protein
MYNTDRTKAARTTTGNMQDAMRRRLSKDYLPSAPKKPVPVAKKPAKG